MTPPGRREEVIASRRGLLGGVAAVAAGSTAGCVQRFRSLLGRDPTRQVSLTIKTVPADADRVATLIARRLGAHLTSVGIDASVVLESEDELRRSVLVNNEFDLYVARYPDHDDPDFLRPLLHTLFADEPGWQNPFGFTDLSVDERLARQRTTDGDRRRTAVAELLRDIARLQPFAVVAFPDEVRAVRTDRFGGWRSPGLTSPLGYLSVRGVAGGTTDDAGLRVTLTDERVTRNFNPIAVEFRNRGTFTGLLYDPLARRVGGEVEPWLAAEWSWSETDSGGTAARVRLRGDVTWHDSRPVTAADVAFTYAFLEDTALGRESISAPSPRFRGRVSLVDSVDAMDERTLRFEFGDTTPAVAVRAFTIPVLPEREWRPRSTPAEIAGLDLFEGVTEALVWDNPEPVGSGPLQFDHSIADEELVLTRFDDHFLHSSDTTSPPFDGGVAFQRMTARVAPSDEAAVALVGVGQADATASSVSPHVVPTIGRQDDTELVVTSSRSFYHVGFNVLEPPLGNPRFRRAIARLIDKRSVADTVFDGFATPGASPLAGTGWTPPDLRWNGGDPVVPFVGTDGELDRPAARELFRSAGYQYGDDGQLLHR